MPAARSADPYRLWVDTGRTRLHFVGGLPCKPSGLPGGNSPTVRPEITPAWYEAGAAAGRHGALIAPTWDGSTQRETASDAALPWASDGGSYSVLPCVPPADGPDGRRLGRRARAERSHGAGFGGPLPARCRQHVAPIHTDSGWIPVELGFTLWAVCPASRAGCRGQLANGPDRDHPDLVRGRCRGPSSGSVDRADLGWVHPAGDGLGRRVAAGLGRRF